MKTEYNLSASSRTSGIASALRQQNLIPAVIYGHNFPNQNLAMPYREFQSVFEQAGRSALIELGIDGKQKELVIVQDVSYHPVTDQFQHVDFFKVSLKEKITTEIPIVLSGEAPAEKELGGSLIQNIDKVNVEALPQDLITEIPADVSVLRTFEDALKISQLPIPVVITVLDDPETVVAFVQEPRSEEELAELEEEVKEDVEAVEVEEKGKKEEEGEVAAEGEAAPAAPAEEPAKAEK